MSEGYYKINPEIRDFIIKEAKERPELGCRKLADLIREKFGSEISKSSISAILKAGGLSKPVGRRAMVGLPIAQAVGRRPSGEKNISLEPQTQTQNTASGVSFKKSSPYQGEAGRGLIVEEKPLLAKIEREISLAPRIIQNDTLSLVVQEEFRQVQAAAGEEKNPPELSLHLGCWFLKAGELCLGGLQDFSALLSSSLKEPAEELLAKNEALFYLHVLGIEEIPDTNSSWAEALAAIIGRRYSAKDIQVHLESLKQLDPALSCPGASPGSGKSGVESANLGLFVQESLEQKEVLGLKFILEDGASFFIDGSTRSIWSKNHIPLEFSQGLSKVRDYLTNAIIQDSFPLIGQSLPGFEAPTPALLSFIVAFSGQKSDQGIKRIELYDNENKLIECLGPIPLKRHYFILGVWPWQYPHRSIFEKEGLRLIGYLKDTKEILVILTNLPENEWDDQRVINLYLERWPNLEAGFQDLLDKIGHYFEVKKTNSPQKDNPVLPTPTRWGGVNQILDFWRMRLSSFCQRHFFPLEYADADFSLLKERFYSLPGVVKAAEKAMEIIFSLPQGFLYANDLVYACQRVNEADIRLWDGRRIRFKIT